MGILSHTEKNNQKKIKTDKYVLIVNIIQSVQQIRQETPGAYLFFNSEILTIILT